MNAHLPLTTLLLAVQLGGCGDNEGPARAVEASRSATDRTPTGASPDSTVTARATAPMSITPREMVVHKSPTCGCCSAWIDYMHEEGFLSRVVESENIEPVKAAHGLVDPALTSCHTALIGGYVIEGHVPAADVRRLLAEKPDIAGLTAPGMPMMSPGMGSREPKGYDVLAFDADGGTEVWSSY